MRLDVLICELLVAKNRRDLWLSSVFSFILSLRPRRGVLFTRLLNFQPLLKPDVAHEPPLASSWLIFFFLILF